MGPVDRAQNVCQICKARKRACDKGLPACGFCSGRGFPCRYDVDAPQRGRRAYNPGKNFVALPLSPPSSVSHPSEHVPGQDQTLPANTSDRSSPSSLSDGFSVGNSVTEQANRLIAGLGIPRDQIGPRYFQDFRSWPPIISSEFFYSLDPLEPESLQKADVSVLLLTISLLITVLDTTNRSTPASCADTRTLYAATRSLFSQAQASVCASLPLLQAGLLLAECEYVYYRPQAACVNLCTCAGMARILGVPDCLSVICTARSDDVSEKDRANVAWVLVLLERVVLMEMDPVGQPPFTKFPSAETPLPPDGQQNPLQISKAAATVSEIHSPNITPFGRQIQVAFLLDLVLQGLRSADQDEDVRLSRHAVLHRRICTFLQAVMDQESEDKISLALAVSFSIRYTTHPKLPKSRRHTC